MQDILTLNHISHTYHSLLGETKTLSDICLSIKDGEFISIVGPSGCGKSTLLSIMAGLITPSYGRLTFHGTNMGYMFQKDLLFEWRSIYKNAVLGLEIEHKMLPEYLNQIDSLLKKYGLYEFKDKKPSQLSGGMRQRAALIRTLALNPDLLLLDEPFSALDYQTRLTVCDDIYKIIKKEHKTAVLVTHDISEAVSIGGRIVILTDRPGTIKSIYEINYDDIYNSPALARTSPDFTTHFNNIWKEIQHEI